MLLDASAMIVIIARESDAAALNIGDCFAYARARELDRRSRAAPARSPAFAYAHARELDRLWSVKMAVSLRFAYARARELDRLWSVKMAVSLRFAYARARELDLPLLFKGDDFRLTDITVA